MHGSTDEARSVSKIDPASIVLYTAISGRYDALQTPPGEATAGVELVAFVDEEQGESAACWNRRSLERRFDDPARNAKIHKILPHRYFPEKAFSLWLDGNVVLNFRFPVVRVVESHLEGLDLVLFRHSRRTCLYQEARAVLRRGADDPDRIWRQIEGYTRDGHPANAGLSECCVLLRRHTAAMRDFNEAWWEEICRGSRRDQLSFDYVARKCGLRYGYFPGSIEGGKGLFVKAPHRDQSLNARIRRVTRTVGVAAAARLSPVAIPMAAALGRYEMRAAARRRARAARAASARTVLAAPLPSVDFAPPRLVPRATSRTRPTIALGPERDFPSWDWVGFDTARELSKYFEVTIYDLAQKTPPDCDVLFVIKEKPAPRFLAEVRARGSRIVYCPIDVYESHEHIAHDAGFLRSCDMVLVHCERQIPLVRPYCTATHVVEHHGRYWLPEMADFKEDGYVLWIGGCQYLSHFLSWVERHPLPLELKVLTDIGLAWTKRGARRFSTLSVAPGARRIAGIEVHPWSERRQLEMMRECKAAIDVKQLSSFNQYFKPPTKAQKFVGSGVPLAVNRGAFSEEYFRSRGFRVAPPDEVDRWLSREYWEETRSFGVAMRDFTSLEAVGARYRELIETLL